MAIIIGRGVRIEVGKTEGAAKTVTAITKASPAVASAAAHGLANKSIGYFKNVGGMVNLEGQACRVANQAAGTFELENLDTTSFPDFTAGEFVPVTAWATLSKATSYSIGGGEADKLDATVLLDDIKQEINGLLAAQSVSINLNAEDVNSEGSTIVENAARNATDLVFRVTLKTGAVRVFRGQPSLPGEDVQRGAIGTGSLSITVKGFVLKGAI